MILISRRKTSPGTSWVRKGVNKVTCSGTRRASSSRRGPGVAGHAAQGSLAPLWGVPGRGQAPRVGFLRVGDLVGNGLALALFLPPLPSAFFWGTPRTSALSSSSLPPKWRVSLLLGVSSGPLFLPEASGPSLLSLRLFAAAYLTHHPGHGEGGGGIARPGPLEATCQGHPGALNSRNQPRGDSRAH